MLQGEGGPRQERPPPGPAGATQGEAKRVRNGKCKHEGRIKVMGISKHWSGD